jgi:N4-gp56 family major capsid protein
MADVYTGQSTLDFSKAAYDRLAYFALRPELYFDAAADIQPTAQSMPGSSVTFTIVNDLPIADTALTETVDVSAVSFSDSQVTLTLAEYGNAVLTTAKLRGTSFVDIDPIVANVVGYNAGVSIDSVARTALVGGTNVMYGSGLGATTLSAVTARTSVVPGTTISSLDIRVARARLRSQNVPTFGGLYVSYVHPDIVSDLQGESVGTSNIQGWRAPHVYSQPGEIWNGEIGSFEGVRFVETPRAAVFNGAGGAGGSATGTYNIVLGNNVSGTYTGAAPTTGATLTAGTGTFTGTATVTSADGGVFYFSGAVVTASGTVTASAYNTNVNVYATVVLGRQSLAKTFSTIDGNGAFPHVVPGPITDRLRRFVPLGWYWLGAYGIFRQASILRIESASLLGADVNTGFDPGIDDLG